MKNEMNEIYLLIYFSVLKEIGFEIKIFRFRIIDLGGIGETGRILGYLERF